MAGQDKDNSNQSNVTGDQEIEPTEQVQEENVAEEYYLLDSKLDELNDALDYLEQKNDDIHERLKELLQSSIDIRQEMRNDMAESSGTQKNN